VDRPQECIDEGRVAELVVGVVVYILIHVSVENLQLLGEFLVPAAAQLFAVLDSPEFVVLLPEIGLEDFGRGQKS
jgi:hypothetical protein